MPPPAFSTDRHDPNLAIYHDLIEQFRERGGRELMINITREVVEANDVGMFTMLVTAAQHHPDVLETLLFGIRYEFEADPVTEARRPDAEWKSDPEVQTWLNQHTHTMPWSVYFFQDHDTRFHTLFADILQRDRDELTIRPARQQGHNIVDMKDEQAHQFCERILHGSLLLLHFCRPTGIDVQPAIEALLAEFDVTDVTEWDYARLYARFEEEIANGFEMRAVAATADSDDDEEQDDEEDGDEDDEEESR